MINKPFLTKDFAQVAMTHYYYNCKKDANTLYNDDYDDNVLNYSHKSNIGRNYHTYPITSTNKLTNLYCRKNLQELCTQSTKLVLQ